MQTSASIVRFSYRARRSSSVANHRHNAASCRNIHQATVRWTSPRRPEFHSEVVHVQFLIEPIATGAKNSLSIICFSVVSPLAPPDGSFKEVQSRPKTGIQVRGYNLDVQNMNIVFRIETGGELLCMRL
jgi:hypothetical protein